MVIIPKPPEMFQPAASLCLSLCFVCFSPADSQQGSPQSFLLIHYVSYISFFFFLPFPSTNVSEVWLLLWTSAASLLRRLPHCGSPHLPSHSSSSSSSFPSCLGRRGSSACAFRSKLIFPRRPQRRWRRRRRLTSQSPLRLAVPSLSCGDPSVSWRAICIAAAHPRCAHTSPTPRPAIKGEGSCPGGQSRWGGARAQPGCVVIFRGSQG